MSRAQQVRDWLATQDGPQPMAAFVEAFPAMRHCRHIVSGMRRTGLLTAEAGDDGLLRYAPGKVPANREAASPEERAAKARAREERKRRAKGVRPLAEHLAARAAEKAAREADPSVQEARREAARERDRRRKRAARAKAQPVQVGERSRGAKRFRETATVPFGTPVHKAPGPPAQTVDDFLARGGHIERLPMHACSQPLRFIGHRAENDRTWRERQRQEATA